MFFVKEFFLTIASYQFLKNDEVFINHGLFFQGYLKKNVSSQKTVLMFSVIENFTFKIANGREYFP